VHLSEVWSRLRGASGCFRLRFCSFIALNSVFEVLGHFSKVRIRSDFCEMLKVGTDVVELLLVAGVLGVTTHLCFGETEYDLSLFELPCDEERIPTEQTA
jgi:hypothetical protein